MIRILILIFTIAFFFSFNGDAADTQSSITGKWKTFDDDGLHDGVIEIYKNDGKYYGKIVFLPKPEDKDSICDNCEGEDKDKPLLGLVILKNMKENKGEYSGGTILDPYSGKVYSCIIKLFENGNKLEVRGFCGFSLFGSSKYWDRLKE